MYPEKMWRVERVTETGGTGKGEDVWVRGGLGGRGWRERGKAREREKVSSEEPLATKALAPSRVASDCGLGVR
jgi:hypothetical protein